MLGIIQNAIRVPSGHCNGALSIIAEYGYGTLFIGMSHRAIAERDSHGRHRMSNNMEPGNIAYVRRAYTGSAPRADETSL